METLDITEVARRTDLTPRALRFYEARGLVAPLRTAAGRRHYGVGELERLNAVVALKRAGFSLSAIAHLLKQRAPDIGRLISARLAALDARAADIETTRTLLRGVQSRLDRGEPVDVATLCSLINTGVKTMAQENWQAVSDRYLSDAAKQDFAAAPYPEGFDQAAYTAKWTDLAARIEAAAHVRPPRQLAGRADAALLHARLGLHQVGARVNPPLSRSRERVSVRPAARRSRRPFPPNRGRRLAGAPTSPTRSPRPR